MGHDTFYFADLEIKRLSSAEKPQLPENWVKRCGCIFSPHILRVLWEEETGWGKPAIEPIHDFPVHPASLVFNFASENMETLKAYRGVDQRIRLFRPEYKMHRLNLGAQRAALPVFDETELLKCMAELIRVDEDWVPSYGEGSFYLRPIIIGTEATFHHRPSRTAILYCVTSPALSGKMDASGKESVEPTKLFADPQYVRAWPGGCGEHKMGCMYAPTLYVNKIAYEHGCEQVLWLFGPDEEITEAGGMNVCIVARSPAGKLQLLTPWLKNNLILPGVIRNSILILAEEQKIVDEVVSDAKISMGDIRQMLSTGRLLEMFGCGTGANFCPIGSIFYKPSNETLGIPLMEESQSVMGRLKRALRNIQEGRVERPDWVYTVT